MRNSRWDRYSTVMHNRTGPCGINFQHDFHICMFGISILNVIAQHHCYGTREKALKTCKYLFYCLRKKEENA